MILATVLDIATFRSGLWLLIGALAALLPMYGLYRLILGWG
jgi:hypothetical protein